MYIMDQITPLLSKLLKIGATALSNFTWQFREMTLQPIALKTQYKAWHVCTEKSCIAELLNETISCRTKQAMEEAHTRFQPQIEQKVTRTVVTLNCLATNRVAYKSTTTILSDKRTYIQCTRDNLYLETRIRELSAWSECLKLIVSVVCIHIISNRWSVMTFR